MKVSLLRKIQLALIGALLTFGLVAGGGAVAQSTPDLDVDDTDTSAPVAGAVDDVDIDDDDDDGGFDDWGLLGLLGLLGLAGLRKSEPDVRTVEREQPVVNPVVDTTRPARTDVDVADDTRVIRDDDVDNTRVTRDDDINPR